MRVLCPVCEWGNPRGSLLHPQEAGAGRWTPSHRIQYEDGLGSLKTGKAGDLGKEVGRGEKVDLWFPGHGRLTRGVGKAWSLSPAGWPWANHLNSLSLSFLTHAMGSLAGPTSRVYCKA